MKHNDDTEVQIRKENVLDEVVIRVGNIKNRVYNFKNRDLQTKPGKFFIIGTVMNWKTCILYVDIIPKLWGQMIKTVDTVKTEPKLKEE